MLAGHIDEIGVMVTHIDDDGLRQLRYHRRVGSTRCSWGSGCASSAAKVRSTGVVGKKAIHIMDKDDREKVSKVEDLWIDIGATSRAEAERRVRIGDPGVLAAGVLEFPNGRLVSRCIDNRIGAFVVLEALRLLAGEEARPAPR